MMDNIDAVGNNNAPNNYTDITNIPLRKWFHLALIEKNANLDCYINGIIAKRISMVSPKQNNDPIYLCQNGGFAGQYSDLFYYNYGLSFMELQTIFYNGPGLVYSQNNLQTEFSTISRSSIMNFLMPTWYFGENPIHIDLSLNTIKVPPPPPPATPPITVATPPPPPPPPVQTVTNVAGPMITSAPQATVTENGVKVSADLSGNYDATGNLIEKDYVAEPVSVLQTAVGSTQKAIADIVKAIAFSLNDALTFHTPFSDMMSGDVRALDNHNIDCSNSSINNFQYINPGDGTFSYNYQCNNPNGGNMSIVNPSQTTPFTATIGSIFDLGNQSVQCPTNSVLSQFKLVNDTTPGNESTASKLQYSYTCLSPDPNSITAQSQPLKCRNVITPAIRSTTNSKYLSGANITCSSDEALSGFSFIPSSDNKTFQYSYSCCKTPYG
jgi:hypothetical protein